MNCVVKQICAKYKMDRMEVEAEFDAISETIAPGRKDGVTAMQILEWCKRHQANGYIVHNGKLTAKHEAVDQYHHLPTLCVQIVGGHAYVMKSTKRWMHAILSDETPQFAPKALRTTQAVKGPSIRGMDAVGASRRRATYGRGSLLVCWKHE